MKRLIGLSSPGKLVLGMPCHRRSFVARNVYSWYGLSPVGGKVVSLGALCHIWATRVPDRGRLSHHVPLWANIFYNHVRFLIWRLLVLSDHVKAPSNHYLSGVHVTLNYVKQTKFHSNNSPIIINKMLSLVWRVDLSQQATPKASQLKRSEITGCQWTLHLTLWPMPGLYLVLSLLHRRETYGASSQVFKKRHFYGNKRKTKMNVWKPDSEPRGQPVNNIFRCQGWSIFCSLKCFWWCHQLFR